MNITEFIARVRQSGQLSDNDEDFDDAEILAEASNALSDHYPLTMVTLRSGYWLHRSTAMTVNGQRNYQMPSRAIANGLEKIEVSVDGGATYRTLSILTDFQATDWRDLNTGVPSHYSFEADTALMYPVPSSPTYTLRYSFYLRPPTLTVAVTGGTIATITGSGPYTVTFSDGPPAFIASSGFIDILHTNGSGEAAAIDVAYVNNAPNIALASGTDITNIRIGDVIRPVQTSDVLPLPIELQRSLADYTAAVVLLEKGDIDKAMQLNSKAENAIRKFVDVALPRTKANPYLFRTRNTYLRRRVGRGVYR